MRSPREADARFKDNILDVAENIALASSHHLIEGNSGIVRQILEGKCRQRSAIGLANSAGIAIRPRRDRYFQFWPHAEFVLKVNSHAVNGDRLRRAQSEILAGAGIDRISGESRQRCEHRSEEHTSELQSRLHLV